jgi:aldehyde dehydrogenase (NAD+)
VVARAGEAFLKWRLTPAPVRGETVRRLGNALREAKANLARLVTLETGKILVEAEGRLEELHAAANQHHYLRTRDPKRLLNASET